MRVSLSESICGQAVGGTARLAARVESQAALHTDSWGPAVGRRGAW